MVILSAGILMYRRDADALRVLLVHPGGPFWRRRDRGAWSIPKGEVSAGEAAEAAARREFKEELGQSAPGPLAALGRIRQGHGKEVEAFAVEGDFPVERMRSATFELEWPPRSGKRQTFSEVDRAAWFTLPAAREMILPGQRPLLDRIEDHLATA
ncbi:NUDIX domain-containing protein [Xanthobacter sp. DSM 24535]|uniref:NUDIX domain-containing protein n=1 Tax=Roseixanthobacter psychrophilus TaxID=3119917 RepID=UPI003727047A